MLVTWSYHKKLFRRIRNSVRHGRFIYLFFLLSSMLVAYLALTKQAWLVAIVAGTAGVLSYRKLKPTPGKPFRNSLLAPNRFSDFGVFTYTPEGFVVATVGGPECVAWADINALFGYKVDLYTTDRIQLDLFLTQGCLCLTEELPGWHPFLRRLAEQFPGIEPNWEIAIATPAFATNLTLLYEKSGLNTVQAPLVYYSSK